MKNIIPSFIREFIKVVIIVAIAVPTIALFAAWTGPIGAPPTNNADAPVNVGPLDQSKLNGWLHLGNLTSRGTTLLARNEGNVGIGTVSPIGSPSPANNKASGNADVNDVYLRSTNKWISEINNVAWVSIPSGSIQLGTLSSDNQSHVYWNDNEDHSPSKICSDAGYKTFSGACQFSFNGLLFEGSLVANQYTYNPNWSLSCHWGGNSYYFDATNGTSKILCIK